MGCVICVMSLLSKAKGLCVKSVVSLLTETKGLPSSCIAQILPTHSLYSSKVGFDFATASIAVPFACGLRSPYNSSTTCERLLSNQGVELSVSIVSIPEGSLLP